MADTHAPAEIETLRDRSIAHLVRHAPVDGFHATALPWLQLVRASITALPVPAVYEPGLVIVLQGRKQVQLGDELITYDALNCLLVSMTTLPRACIAEATAEQPYLCLRLDCNTQHLAELLLEIDSAPPTHDAATPGLHLAPVTEPLLDATLRLLRLLDAPQDQHALAPLVRREIFYRVLTGPLGPQLRALARGDGTTRRLSRVIERLTSDYAAPLSIDELAALAHMSPSTLHQRFKQLTALSPLQFQKQLRLQQARKLMLGEGLDAAAAAHRVGYESPSQFSREYRRLFGAPPRADVSGGGPAQRAASSERASSAKPSPRSAAVT